MVRRQLRLLPNCTAPGTRQKPESAGSLRCLGPGPGDGKARRERLGRPAAGSGPQALGLRPLARAQWQHCGIVVSQEAGFLAGAGARRRMIAAEGRHPSPGRCEHRYPHVHGNAVRVPRAQAAREMPLRVLAGRAARLEFPPKIDGLVRLFHTGKNLNVQ